MRGRRSTSPAPVEPSASEATPVDRPAPESRVGVAVATRPRRLDESMSLLTDLYSSAMDDEYRAAAERKHRVPDTSAADVGAESRLGVLLRQPAVMLGVGVLVIGMLLATTVIDQRRGAPAVAVERQSLIDRINTVTARAAALRQDVDSAGQELQALQDRVLQRSVLGEQVSAELDQLAAMSGEAALAGPGLRITVDDAPPGTVPDDDPSSSTNGRVQDIDLQQLVNGLWEAGAEAIAVDGTRVGARSSIRAAGDALIMDQHPLAAPYEVVAIGDPSNLGARFLDTYAADWFQVLSSLYGVEYDVENEDSVEVPSAGATDLRWAATYGQENE